MKKSNDNLGMLEEIEEEVRNDEVAKFLQKNWISIASGIALVVVGICAYSSWHDRKIKKEEDITNALIEIVQNPVSGDNLMLAKLVESAPAELRPILVLLKNGKQAVVAGANDENLEPILDLANRKGVNIVWRDLATIIYTSYSNKSPEELIKMLEPLTAADRPFRFSAMEFIAMFNMNMGKADEALKLLEGIVKNAEAPTSMKKRIEVLAQYVKGQSQDGTASAGEVNNKVADEAANQAQTAKSQGSGGVRSDENNKSKSNRKNRRAKRRRIRR